MAQTKTKSSGSSRRSNAAAAQRRASNRGSTSRKSPNRRSNGGSPGSSPGSSSSAKSRPAARGPVSRAAETTKRKAQESGNTVGKAASKAKTPLVAGGAAVLGAAGGLALGARQARRRRGISVTVPRRPQVKVKSRDIAKAAKEVGSFGTQMGRLASEIQQTREAANGEHRSPVEVVLDGLTSRRSRH
jgi:hypothetical protein